MPSAVHADAGVFRRRRQARRAIGRGADALIAARDHHDLGLQVDGEFQRPGVHDRAILGDQFDPGAGLRPVPASQRGNRDAAAIRRVKVNQASWRESFQGN